MKGKGIFHGDQKNLDLHEKSRDLSYYDIFQQKILKSQPLKKMRCIGIFMPRCLTLPLKNPSKLTIIPRKNPRNLPKMRQKY